MLARILKRNTARRGARPGGTPELSRAARTKTSHLQSLEEEKTRTMNERLTRFLLLDFLTAIVISNLL